LPWKLVTRQTNIALFVAIRATIPPHKTKSSNPSNRYQVGIELELLSIANN